MYHHRYQPQTSHLANRNANAFATNNYRSNSSTSRANAQVSSESGPRVINTGSSSSSVHHVNNKSNFGNHHKPAANSVYHSGAYSSQPRQFAEERQDVIFRRVRGILNKITPETFDKLSNELVNVGLDSPRTLRGLIYLLFDKALKDLKYSSLYAKLCQELSEKAPNFETEPGPNTFCKFLISKCEDEFERRRKATEDFDGKGELTDEEYEQKAIAKQKMLGNIKFICELGKKRLLQEEILHECIRGLLSKKKERPLQDQAQDLECLCQIMRTIGSLLDIEASRNLMNQYFERIDMYSRKSELPSRIRFMLRDVIDLRNNKWRPRPFQKEDNVPQPLSKLREESGYNCGSTNASIDKIGNTKNLFIGDLSKMHGGKFSSLLLEDDGPSFTTTTDFHWGSNTFLPNESEFDIFSATMPAYNKIGASTNYSNTNRDYPYSIAVVKKTLTNHNEYPVPISSSNRLAQKSENHINVNNNNISGTHGRIDPFSDSFKVNKQGRLQTSKEIFGTSGNRNDSKTNTGSHLTEQKQESALQSTGANVPRNNDHNFAISAYQERDPFLVGQNRGNNSAHNRQADTRVVVPRDSSKIIQSSRGPVEEMPRSFTQPRDGRMSPNSKFMNGNRHFHDSSSQQHQPHLPNQMTQNQANQPRNHRQPLANHHLPDHKTSPQLSGYNPVHRDRPFERLPRQPKFSGANYRLPGRDNKPLVLMQMNQPPESELNMNWRATGSSALNGSTKDSNINEKMRVSTNPGTSVVQNTLDQLHHAPGSSMDQHTGPDIFDVGKGGSRQEKDRPIDEQNMVRHVLTHPSTEDLRESESKVRSISPATSKITASRIDVSRSSDRFSGRKEDNLASNINQTTMNAPMAQQDKVEGKLDRARLNDRPSQINQIDARNRDRMRRGQQEIEDRKQPVHRPRENFDSRNYRPAFARNQSLDDKPPITVERVRDNWRKDVPPMPIRKDNLPFAPGLVGSPLLTKPPTRMSESDFSLRPSHNLVGRSQLDNPILSTIKSRDQVLEQTVREISTETESTKQANVSEQNSIEDKNDVSCAISPDHSSKELHVKKFMSSLCGNSNFSSSEVVKIASKVKELKIPRSCQAICLVSAMKHSIVGSESDREGISKLLVGLVPSTFEPSSLLKAFKDIFEQLNALEAETPKVKSLLAEFLSRAVFDGLLSLAEVGSVLSGGKHHPLFLLLLQKLEKRGGQVWLSEKFNASKINLMDMLPEVDRSKDRLANALKDRCLGFLDPMLTIEPDLWAQMKNHDPSPAAIYRWIRDNVDQSIQGTSTFAHVFVGCLLRYINKTAEERYRNANSGQQKGSDSDNSNKSSPSSSSTQAIGEIENELLSKYQQILQAILKDKQMQLATIYALQAFYHGMDFPKGALLRWFNMLYDMSIVDDDVFFIWKEEINDVVPGKGQALFQVNTWLNWLAEAESEEEDDS